MLQKLFLTILEISIASSMVILLLLLLSPLLGRRYIPKLRYLLWLVIAVRLLVPVNMPWSNALRLNLFQSMEVQTSEPGWFLPNPATIIETENPTETQGNEIPTTPRNVNPTRINPAQILTVIWESGMFLFLVYHIGAYLYTRRKLRRWSTPLEDEAIILAMNAVKRELSICCEIKIRSSSQAASPLLLGFIRPCVVLPEQPFTAHELDFMLRHELWHLSRKDLWYKLILLLANAVHWFNPLVYLIVRQANLDTELACDADVLRGAGIGERKIYGYTILSFMERGWRCKTPLTTRFYGGKTQMKQRFKYIADTSAKRSGVAFFCTAALVVALAGCAVQASARAEATPQPEVYPAALTVETKPSLEQVPAKPAEANERIEIEAVFNQIEWTTDPYSGGEMAWPLPDHYRIIAHYGVNPQTSLEDYHTGIDIAGEQGASIIASNVGVVKYVQTEWQSGIGYGMHLVIDHGGEMSTLYAHCSKIIVSVGDKVEKGQKVAEVGATGWAQEPHLHFEVRKTGQTAAPMPYITSKGFVWPTNGGNIASGINSYPDHAGIDIAGIPEGTPVYAAAAGTVSAAKKTNTGYGNHIIVDHGNGYRTLYGHNSELYVTVGDVVEQGQIIAAIGRSGYATGYMLHFEIRHNGKVFDPEVFLTVPAINE